MPCVGQSGSWLKNQIEKYIYEIIRKHKHWQELDINELFLILLHIFYIGNNLIF